MNNEKHTAQNLLHDHGFRRLVEGAASDEKVEEWNAWIEKSPENKEKAKEASRETLS